MVAALNLALIMQLAGVALAVAVDPYIRRENRCRVYAIVALVLYLLAEPQISTRFGDLLYRSAPVFWFTLLSALSYIARTLVLALFIRISGLTRGRKVLYMILAGNAVLCLSAFFVPWVFTFDANLRWHRGPLGFVPFAVSFLLNVWLVAGAIIKYRNTKIRESLAPVILSVFVAVAVILDVRLDYDPAVSFLTVAMTESSVFFYIWLHLQFVREHESALKAEQRIRIMVSQIQPHFLFNTLTTIQALTDIDPEKASEVIQKFAVYLRQNIDSLNREALIPVEKEIEHTRIYSEIEEVRFPSIRIDYEIEDKGFLLPPLTVQPMVENAIRHGVRGKKDGWVSVSVYREGSDHVISIRDNGKGFDVEQMINETRKGDHIGVKNVRDRIVDMTGGTFAIESEIGEGTSVTIRIPAEGAR
ncbi:MAG: histidine kinase [Lachnospiraceae bacterium]|nr:histidine kinase [Lachnospiraceae bacterium]